MRYYELLTEMVAPSENMRTMAFYHGTKHEDKALSIMQHGLRPGNAGTTARGRMQPVAGRTYLTSSLKYGIIYAIGGDMLGCSEASVPYLIDKAGRHGYLFVVDGQDLADDVQPDEDSVGAAVMHADRALKGDTRGYENDAFAQNIFRSQKDWIARFVYFAKTNMTSKQFYDSVHGEVAAWASGGKRLLKKMPDDFKRALIHKGAHVAYLGPIQPNQCWKFDKTLTPQLHKDGSNFFELAERVR